MYFCFGSHGRQACDVVFGAGNDLVFSQARSEQKIRRHSEALGDNAWRITAAFPVTVRRSAVEWALPALPTTPKRWVWELTGARTSISSGLAGPTLSIHSALLRS